MALSTAGFKNTSPKWINSYLCGRLQCTVLFLLPYLLSLECCKVASLSSYFSTILLTHSVSSCVAYADDITLITFAKTDSDAYYSMQQLLLCAHNMRLYIRGVTYFIMCLHLELCFMYRPCLYRAYIIYIYYIHSKAVFCYIFITNTGLITCTF